MFNLIHFIHVIAGSTFVGSVVFFEWVIGTAMVNMTPAFRKELSLELWKISDVVIIGSFLITIITGISRLFMSGIVQNFEALFSGYGLRASLALLILIGFLVISGPMYKKLRVAIDDENNEMFHQYLHRTRLFSLISIIAILFLMVSMRMGIF